MALESHRGQILPLSNQLIPISKNTVFHASYDNSLFGLNQAQKVSQLGHEKALEFNGTSSYVNLGNTIINSVTNKLTVEAWVYPTTVGGGVRAVVGQWVGASDCSYMIYQNNTTYSFGVRVSGAAVYATTGAITANSWYHICGVYDGANVSIYVNGVLAQSVALTGNVALTTHATRIGSYSTGGQYFQGRMNDIRIWNVALTAQQVASNVYSQLNGDEPGIVGCWKLNEGQGPAVNDSSLYGNDGIVTNGTWVDGRTIVTLRQDGKFSGAVGVESATTNLLVNPTLQTTTNWEVAAGISIALNNSVAPDGTMTAAKLESTVSTGSLKFYRQLITTASSTPYTFSIYAKRGTNRYIGLRNTESANSVHATFDFDTETWANAQSGTTNTYQKLWNGWYRLTSTRTEGTGASRYMSVCIVNSDGAENNTMAIGQSVYIWNPQGEVRNFATSFVSGSRAKGILTYPKSTLPLSSFTFNAWVKVNGYTTIPQPIFELGADNTTRILLSHRSSTNAIGLWKTGHADMVSSVIPPVDTWYMITVTYDGTSYKLYYNGALQMTQTEAKWVGTDKDTLNIGGYYEGTLDGLIDDVRIDNVAASSEEIQSWYYSNSPFYNYLDYTGVGY